MSKREKFIVNYGSPEFEKIDEEFRKSIDDFVAKEKKEGEDMKAKTIEEVIEKYEKEIKEQSAYRTDKNGKIRPLGIIHLRAQTARVNALEDIIKDLRWVM